MPVALIAPLEMFNKPEAPYAVLLRDAGFQVRYPTDPRFCHGHCTQAETIEQLRGVSGVIAAGEHYTDPVLAALPELRVVARAGVGYDRVDVPAATKRNVAVTITPTANHEAVAEQTLSLIFSLIKGTAWHDKEIRAGRWPKAPRGAIRGKTLGIFGLGRIGRSLAIRAKALGMKVIACEAAPQASFVTQQAIEIVDFENLLARSDILSLHAPLTADTKGLINKSTIAKMKRGAVLINTARGPMVVERDLHAALVEGHLSGAGLDVFEQEPPDPANPLFTLDNVVLTPHVAGGDELSLVQMGVEAAQCIVALSRGQWPEGAVVNGQIRDGWKW